MNATRVEETVPGRDEKKGYVPTYRRERTTKTSVLLADKAANLGITAGGLLVIVAVFGIMAFLLAEALPLFQGGRLEGHTTYTLPPAPQQIWLNVDEYRTVGVRVSADGRVDAFHFETGTPLAGKALNFANHRATAIGVTEKRDDMAFGFEDGTVRFGRVAPVASVVTPDDLPKGMRQLANGDLTDGTAVYRSLPGNQYRRVALETTLDEPQKISPDGAAIIAIDYRLGGTVERPTRSFVTVDQKGVIRLSRAETRIHLMTRKATTTVSTSTLPPLPEGAVVRQLLMTSQADQVFVGGAQGVFYRFDTRDFNKPSLAETVRVLPGGVGLTRLGFLLGEQTLVVGGSNGMVLNLFLLQREDAGTPDGYTMVVARVLEPHEAAIEGFGASQRRKSFVTSDARGNVWYRHATSERVLLRFQDPQPKEGGLVMVSPRDDAVIATDRDGTVNIWSMYVPHPETTLASIFGKVWYEGYSAPTYTWQSSSGTDVFEPKFSLMPLIFGTIKATIYSLLFAVPIALLGAIYTSEFVNRRVRAGIKPVMEMMESLPTVVLGFVAALILAPLVETWIAAVVLGFVVLPLSLMLGAFAWQMLPHSVALRYGGLPKFSFMFVVIALAAWLSYGAGPWFERVFFYGDFKAWTNGDEGTGTPFMFLVLLPLCYLAISWAFGRTVGTTYRLMLREMPRSRSGMIDAIRWAVMLFLAAALSLSIAALLTWVGYDPRGGAVDTYVQRNALVVGFVMGFAVIPNIYTLAEDALNAVPSSLRAASLAAGASPWQTAIWVVLPTALSGVFAAVMIGMGRAVGETMIVVMAAGNTPILEWNVFNGLRTLSANIAVELPEAVRDGSLYRMLFFAALTLFVLTFCTNTVAEVIRQRFRRRAFQL